MIRLYAQYNKQTKSVPAEAFAESGDLRRDTAAVAPVDKVINVLVLVVVRYGNSCAARFKLVRDNRAVRALPSDISIAWRLAVLWQITQLQRARYEHDTAARHIWGAI